MEVFSVLKKWNVEQKGYDYHPQCKELQISHMAFADDLFLIATATNRSFLMMKETIVEFKELSSLVPSFYRNVHLF